MKFLVDMGIGTDTVLWLRNQGYDAIHLREQRLQKMPDDAIIEKARTENRIILTLDLDFSRLIALSGEKLPSIISFRLDNEKPENINARMKELLFRFSNILQEGAVLSVGEESIRVRRLPIR